MRLTELLNKDEVTISCELFPPKQGAQLENYKNIVKDMAALKPAYMSVTYGATGGTSDYTVKLAEEVRNNNIPALAHLTCASSTREKVASVIEELKAANIENILALRGDIPANADFPLPDQYKHASELIADIKKRGAIVEYNNGGGQKGQKKNDSIDQRIKVNAQMLKILDSLGIKPVGDDSGDDEDEL